VAMPYFRWYFAAENI
jgi:hypothetical protein